MALKRKVTKAEYDKLSDEMKKLYESDGDDYVLDIEGYENPDELRRARDREKEDKKKAQKELKEARERLAELDGDDARKTGDIEKIDGAWKEKFAKAETEHSNKVAGLVAFIKKTLVNTTAEGIANKISNAPKLLAKAIADRLTVDFEGDEPALVVLGEDGKPSAMKLDGLEKEFVANKEYSAIILGNKASGGGAPRNGPEPKPGGAPASDPQNTSLAKMSPKDLAARLKAQKEAGA